MTRDRIAIARRIADSMEAPSSFCDAVARLAMTTAADDEETAKDVKKGLLGCLKGGVSKCIKEALKEAKKDIGEVKLRDVFPAVWRHLRDKLNIRKTVRDIWKLALKHGWKMAIVAIVWEIFEDIVIPGIAVALGHPEVAPIMWAIHLEPIVYPIAFCLLR